jgi:excisionase family DNA binding protein
MKEKVEKPAANGHKQPEINGDAVPLVVNVDFIDEQELCRRLGISRGTAVNHRASGQLPFCRVGKQIRYHWATVQASLLRQPNASVQ